jgi:hypothetical protein
MFRNRREGEKSIHDILETELIGIAEGMTWGKENNNNIKNETQVLAYIKKNQSVIE